jgi:O-antigen/teichoic acid export membrane protein
MLTGHFSTLALKLAGNLILTRILAPEAFGLMAIANVTLLGLTMLSEVGLKQNVIQTNKALDNSYLNTIWTMQLIKGLIVAAIVWSSAAILYLHGHSLGGVYQNELLPYILIILSANPVIWGFETTKTAVANRELELGLISRLTIYSQATGVSVSIICALSGLGIWSLVAGPIASSILRVGLANILLPGKLNRPQLDRDSFTEIFNFGKWVFLGSILTFVVGYGDQLILGGFLNEERMADYAIALFIFGIIRQVASKFANDIALPRLSDAIRKNSEVMRTYYKLRLPVDAFSLVISGTLFVSGSTIIDLLYDDRYSGAGTILSIISVALIAERFALTHSFLLASGNPKLVSVLAGYRAVLLIIGLPSTIMYGSEYYGIVFIATYKLLEIPVLIKVSLKNSIFCWKIEAINLLFWPLGFAIGHFINYAIRFWGVL